ncbi:MAG: hypothetical protein AB7D03_03845 [Thiomicrospira sp.]
MSELLRQQNQVLAVNMETVYGTAATVDGSHAVLAADMTVNMLEGNVAERNNITGFMGAQGGITVGRKTTASFGVEFAGSGTASTPPAWGKLLRGCGMAEVIGASDVTYAPVGSGFESLTLLYRLEKIQQRLKGARGKFTLNLDSQTIPMMKFDFEALYEDPSIEAGVLVGVDTSAFKKPLGQSKDTATVTFLGAPVRMQKLSIDLGVETQFVEDLGGESVEIVGRTGSVSMSFRTTDAQLVAALQNASNNTEGALNAVHGKVAGSILTVDVPNLQVKTAKVSWDGEIANVDVEADIKPLTANTDLTITQS